MSEDPYVATLEKLDKLVARLEPKNNPNRNEMYLKAISELVSQSWSQLR